MIILLNGPFGIGKTTTAQLLVERLPDAMLYDPELVGMFLTTLVKPVERRHDYQDFSLWPRLFVDIARLLRETYGRTLIIPMTLWRYGYFATITSGLREVDQDLLCVRLTATETTVRSRILARPDSEGSHAWCLDHLDGCLSAARNPAFGVEVATEGHTPDDVAGAVLALCAGAG
jgi:hypothetical protein